MNHFIIIGCVLLLVSHATAHLLGYRSGLKDGAKIVDEWMAED